LWRVLGYAAGQLGAPDCCTPVAMPDMEERTDMGAEPAGDGYDGPQPRELHSAGLADGR